MPRPIQAIVHTAALAHNLDLVRGVLQGTKPSSNVWAVIKANAYGHGIEAAVSGFQESDGLALLDLDEAVRARQARWDKPILLLEGPFQMSDLGLVAHHQLTPVIHNLEQLAMLRAFDGSLPAIYLKLDTGMTRLGFLPVNLQQAFDQIDALVRDGKLGKVTYMTHFACADRLDGLDDPLQRFVQMVTNRPGAWCLSNSAACLLHADKVAGLAAGHGRSLWSRPGICLYGASPFSDRAASDLGFKPAMTLRSELISVKDVQAGEGIGYGRMFVADRPMRVGVVACGYADGYPRHAPTGTPVAVGGQITRILGRVSMDMMTVDLSGLSSAGVGTPVVLWGEGGPSVDEVAKAAATIGYELLSGVTARVPRVVL
ncbi:alanine racemase [Orrella daihaiensis]|uniref:Alanine racemase n=1 Tax=Orrella daihaiensis TaxID=2782176 RepID=A0ABY4AR23_9BURK|nr:alanine racemase [Orrella daihaiensis]UOD51472.1 alanine racemase [Orrella daihaiensis]